MCGAFQQFPTLNMAEMLASLNVQDTLEGRGMCRPGSSIQIIIGCETLGNHQIVDATWWLLLNKQSNEDNSTVWKPNNNYKTFNTRSEKLLESRLAKKPYLNTRCLIPAAGFMESKSGVYHHVTNAERSVAFGGLYKEYETDDGEILYSASIITLPAHPDFEFAHHRMPLILNTADIENTSAWLHKNHFPEQDFDLSNSIHTTLEITPSSKYGNFDPSGETVLVG